MSVTVISKLKIQNAANSPIIDSEDATGAWSTVANAAERDAIVSSARRLHMVVTLADTGVSYELATGLTNADWVVKAFGGGAASTITNDSAVPGTHVSDALNNLMRDMLTAGAAETNANVTISDAKRRVLPASTLAGSAKTMTINPIAQSGLAFVVLVGTQAFDYNFSSSGPLGNTYTVTAGNRQGVSIISDGANVQFSAWNLQNEPVL